METILVLERRARSTKTVVQLWRDLDDMPWMTVCADHGGCVGHDTRKLAEGWLSHPEEWCPTCRGDDDENDESG